MRRSRTRPPPVSDCSWSAALGRGRPVQTGRSGRTSARWASRLSLACRAWLVGAVELHSDSTGGKMKFDLGEFSVWCLRRDFDLESLAKESRPASPENIAIGCGSVRQRHRRCGERQEGSLSFVSQVRRCQERLQPISRGCVRLLRNSTRVATRCERVSVLRPT